MGTLFLIRSICGYVSVVYVVLVVGLLGFLATRIPRLTHGASQLVTAVTQLTIKCPANQILNSSDYFNSVPFFVSTCIYTCSLQLTHRKLKKRNGMSKTTFNMPIVNSLNLFFWRIGNQHLLSLSCIKLEIVSFFLQCNNSTYRLCRISAQIDINCYFPKLCILSDVIILFHASFYRR